MVPPCFIKTHGTMFSCHLAFGWPRPNLLASSVYWWKWEELSNGKMASIVNSGGNPKVSAAQPLPYPSKKPYSFLKVKGLKGKGKGFQGFEMLCKGIEMFGGIYNSLYNNDNLQTCLLFSHLIFLFLSPLLCPSPSPTPLPSPHFFLLQLLQQF